MSLFVPQADPPDLTAFLPLAAPLQDSHKDGRIDASHTPYLYQPVDRHLLDAGAALMIGSAGADGTEFALRKGQPGVWMYRPNDDAWTEIAADILEFETLWLASQINV
ncbi:hypothetical protein [Gymnodinialimonas sp. 57CJ19]|uniref:hypothetical protein n=1 Tax=Gymnodinialimonas sp. 57CJ19 TaxID=3138498 RepID=UPI003134599B